MEELLISLVRQHPAIYDKRDSNYKDRMGVVANIWRHIAEELKAAGYLEFDDYTHIAEKWSKLRDAYYQAKKRYDKRFVSGSAANNAPTWHLWHQLNWLDDYMGKRKTDTNAPETASLAPLLSLTNISSTTSLCPPATSAASTMLSSQQPNLSPTSTSPSTNLPLTVLHQSRSSPTASTMPCSPTPANSYPLHPMPEPSIPPLTMQPSTSSSLSSSSQYLLPTITTSPLSTTSSTLKNPHTKKRKHSKSSSCFEESLANHLDYVLKRLKAQEQVQDDSQVLGNMVAAQHRLLSKKKQAMFLQKVQQAFLDTLNSEEIHD